MNTQAKTCSIMAHQNKEMKYFCTFRQCNINQKFLCQDCVNENFHLHDQNNNDHLLNEEQFKTKLQIELDNLQDRHSYNNQQDPLQINVRKLKTDINLMINNLKEIKQQLEIQSYDDYKYELVNRGHKHLQTHHFSQLGNFAKELLSINQAYSSKFNTTFQKIQDLIQPINQKLNESNKIIESILKQELNFPPKLQKDDIKQDQFYENCVLIKKSLASLIQQDDSGIKRVIQQCLSTDPERLSSYISGNIFATNIDSLCEGDIESNQIELENMLFILVVKVYLICKDQNLLLKSYDNKKLFEDQKLAIWDYLINQVENKDIITNVFDRISNYHKKEQGEID